jgi:hypothetical protein
MKWVFDNFQGTQTYYSRKLINQIKAILKKSMCKKCPDTCDSKMVEHCAEKEIFDVIEGADK